MNSRTETPISSVIRQCYERNLAMWLFTHHELCLTGTPIEGGRIAWFVTKAGTVAPPAVGSSHTCPFKAIARAKEYYELYDKATLRGEHEARR